MLQMMEDREETRRRNVVSYRDDEDPVSLRCLSIKVDDGDSGIKRVVFIDVASLREFCPTRRTRSQLVGGSETCRRSLGSPNRRWPSAGELDCDFVDLLHFLLTM